MRPRKLAKEETAPLYKEVASRLVSMVQSGQFSVGSMLPPELDLCERFSVSRHTMREAIRELTMLGMISRRQGSGTRIESTEPVRRFIQSVGSLKEIQQYVAGSQLVLCAQEDVPETADLGWLEGWSRRLRLIKIKTKRVNTATGAIICWTEVYLRAAHRSVIKYINQPDTTIFSILEERCGARIHEVRQDISACALPNEAAKHLGVPKQSPGLQIIRHYLNDKGALVEASISSYPADSFTYSIRLTHQPAFNTGKTRIT